MGMVKKLQQEDYEQQFNDCCANIVGLVAGNGCTDQIYFRDDALHGTYECKIEDYVPYTSFEQLQPVIEILKSTLGFTIDLEMQNREGALATYRSMVDEMLDATIDCDNHPYETCAEREEAEEAEDEYDKNHSKPHPMYDDNLQAALEENTKRQFEHSLRLNMPYGENGTVSKEVIKGCVGRERFWEDEEDDAEIIMNDFTYVGNPRSIGWQAARILILAHYRGYDDMYIDMAGEYNVAVRGNNARNEIVRFTELVEDGLLQAHKIEAYIRNPENCMEWLWRQVSTENPYVIPPLDNINLEHLHQHRLRIIEGVLYERATEYKTPKDVFNELCQRITKTVMKHGYVIDTSTFNPYQDIQQLTRIVEIVLAVTGEPFVVNGQGGVNMMKEMQEHIEVYSTEKYMTLEDL